MGKKSIFCGLSSFLAFGPLNCVLEANMSRSAILVPCRGSRSRDDVENTPQIPPKWKAASGSRRPSVACVSVFQLPPAATRQFLAATKAGKPRTISRGQLTDCAGCDHVPRLGASSSLQGTQVADVKRSTPIAVTAASIGRPPNNPHPTNPCSQR